MRTGGIRLLVYAILADPRYGSACERLLERIDNQDIQGFTSAHVLSEMAHRVMTLEAVTRFNRPLAGMANWLRVADGQQPTLDNDAVREALSKIPGSMTPDFVAERDER